MKKIFKNRYSALFAFVLYFILGSFIVRFALTILSFSNISDNISDLILVFLKGFSYDIYIALCFVLIYSLYLLLIPSKFIGSKADKSISYFILGLMFFISLFAFAAEFPFWDEFKTRFNFIAVDYLIYTFEVVENINQSYPIPLILLGLAFLIFILFWTFSKFKIFDNTFSNKMRLGLRSAYSFSIIIATILLSVLLKNSYAEYSNNTYINELSKNGVYSFFTAFKSNELNYDQFYQTLPEKEAYSIIKKELLQEGDTYTNNNYNNITRSVKGNKSETPNIVLICIESFSADFLDKFGNTNHITPYYEKLAKESVFFTNIFATGTRTVRGMEALTLSVPPTPGNSIVRRQDNENLFSVATILKKKNYELSFIYGGDGYFDNMNAFFGGQGFTIVDRDRGNPLPENIKTKRINIEDKDVSFENAWGICDEDLYKQSLKMADLETQSKKPFFQFVMTTSNHKPYTFPENKISLPQGSRDAAVRYTDFALEKYMEQARNKPWFKNTVFVIIADHCASSAGKWEISPEKHHIPAIIYNCKNYKGEVNKLASQIDVMPTLFSMLNWQFNTALYGKNIFKTKPEEERALIGNYRTLGLLKNNVFTQINDHKEVKQFQFNTAKNSILNERKNSDENLKKLTISYYQTASHRFKNGEMKENKN